MSSLLVWTFLCWRIKNLLGREEIALWEPQCVSPLFPFHAQFVGSLAASPSQRRGSQKPVQIFSLVLFDGLKLLVVNLETLERCISQSMLHGFFFNFIFSLILCFILVIW